MTPQEAYDKAVAARKKIASSIKSGMTESKQGQLDAATDEVIKHRNKLIELGMWDRPIPIPVRAKYRRH